MIVRESLNEFERGKDPEKALKIGKGKFDFNEKLVINSYVWEGWPQDCQEDICNALELYEKDIYELYSDTDFLAPDFIEDNLYSILSDDDVTYDKYHNYEDADSSELELLFILRETEFGKVLAVIEDDVQLFYGGVKVMEYLYGFRKKK